MSTVPQIEVTISYLEMQERPQNLLLQSPQGKRTSLIRAYKPTVSFYRYLYNTIGEPWLWWERRVLSDDELSQIIQDDNVEIYVLYYDGVPAGYAELDRRKPSEIDLAYMGLIPDFIGQKLGPYLLSSIIDIVWSYEPTRLTVNTCSLDHPKALGVYQKCGFNIYDRNVKTIDDPKHSYL
ncbi:GNAT family acetyltransferase [Kiloniella spongiae]|uniref:GNAT family acetyltransferase n=1 Tax=Kiloniella spongiae TaxID=1489064 RepID=A0A0H2ML61_9PROT|nr:GNAT family N-acetyltransferase [Kiloniella spongiae]KLN61462.1 GNAT family acetyltransferase [Kiloniella spongiae]